MTEVLEVDPKTLAEIVKKSQNSVIITDSNNFLYYINGRQIEETMYLELPLEKQSNGVIYFLSTEQIYQFCDFYATNYYN